MLVGRIFLTRIAAIGMIVALTTLWPDNKAVGEVLRVGKSNSSVFAYVPLDVGVEKGFFAKQGLDVQIIHFGRAPLLEMALTSDDVDIGLSSGVEMALIAKNLPVKAVGAVLGAPVEVTITVDPKGPIKSVADLKGRSVAVSQIASLTGWLVGQLSIQQGWGQDGIRRATIGSPEGYWAALATQQIDGASVDLSSALQAERMGRGKILIVDGDLVKTFHANVIFATNKLIAEKPETVRAFLKGWYETTAFMRAHKDETIVLAKQIQNVDADIASSTYDIVMKELSGDGKFNPKALDVLAESFVDMGVLNAKPDMSRFITEEFLPH
jgi:NitT/TauT family transport system substrate-binding protein